MTKGTVVNTFSRLRRAAVRAGRPLALVVLAALVFTSYGDGVRAAYTIQGIDPLGVLDLKVRPNVILVLDSSTSMIWGLKAPTSPSFYAPESMDHPRSKLMQAKQVLAKVVADNTAKASFLMAHYGQSAATNVTMGNTAATVASATAGKNRFQYSTYSCGTGGATCAAVSSGTAVDISLRGTGNQGLVESTTMTVAELSVQNDRGGSGGRGLQSWQLIFPPRMGPLPGWPTATTAAGWNTLYYSEVIGGTTYTCPATLDPGTGPSGERFFAQGGKATTAAADIAGSLAAALKAKMNACARTTGKNTYDVTYNATTGRFTFQATNASPKTWSLLWQANAARPNNIAGVFAMTNNQTGASSYQTAEPYSLLYRSTAAASNSAMYGGNDWNGISYKNLEQVGAAATPVTIYTMAAGRFYNGETIKVDPAGQICDMSFPTVASRTSPPSFKLQQVSAGCGADVAGAVATFRWGGAYQTDTGGGDTCSALFKNRVNLIPCDLPQVAPNTQVDRITPWLLEAFPLSADRTQPNPAPLNNVTGGAATAYVETQNGTWTASSTPPHGAGGIKVIGGTPLAKTLGDIKTSYFGTSNTTGLWGAGKAAVVGPPVQYVLDPIKNHANPKEKTIVILVTDGEDYCVGSSGTLGQGDNGALIGAYNAEKLYTRIVASEPASSVETFVVGFGGAFTGNTAPRLDWMAWGGSGLGASGVAATNVPNNGTRWTPTFTGTSSDSCAAGSACASINAYLKQRRDKCLTCRNAYIAPDAATLAQQLQSIIDQGATEGEYSASGGGSASSVTDSIWEYVDRVETIPGGSIGSIPDPFDARNPNNRYQGLVPTRFVSTFTLPGFEGQIKAYQNDGVDNAIQMWSGKSAAEKLDDSLNARMNAVCTGATAYAPATAGQCIFDQLTGGATYATIGTSTTAGIRRRIFTTAKNGYFGVTATQLMNAEAPSRVALWPPQSDADVDPPTATVVGRFDAVLGLPITSTAADFTALQEKYKACTGAILPAGCTSADLPTKVGTARKEARQMILAFMAGAEVVPSTSGPLRVTNTGANLAQILYRKKDVVFADSTLSTSAVIGPPLNEPESLPAAYQPEYILYRDGPRDSAGKNPDSGGAQIKMGFGLARPDVDNTTPPSGIGTGAIDTRALKPVMTVLYVAANDGVHALRAAPNCAPHDSGCAETGGEELWVFVPYDQINKLATRFANYPDTRANHTYMIGRGLRYSDVFVREALTSVNIGGVTVPSMDGVWRKVLIFGRGAGGKYLTALDVTAPGKFTDAALSTTGPIPLWNRGNPDTEDGTDAGPMAHDTADLLAYRKMGETWSVPSMAYVAPNYTARKLATATPSIPVEFTAILGSGFGPSPQGSAIFTLDALTGDVVATADIVPTAGQATDNAIVANVVGFSGGRYKPGSSPHPAGYLTTRVYVGDLYGQVWKVLTSAPNKALLAADLGPGQPIATPLAVLGWPPSVDATTKVTPYIYGETGNDLRYDGPFKYFGLMDEGLDDNSTVGAPTSYAGIKVYDPVTVPKDLDDGTPFLPKEFDSEACGAASLPQSYYRGDVQPATAFEGIAGTLNSFRGVVFFAANRLNLPNTRYAPPTPLLTASYTSCSAGEVSQYPCRSRYDSILYALGATSGGAAYSLGGANDAYRIFYNARTGSIGTQVDPGDKSGAQVNRDETLVKAGEPIKPPPVPGLPPVLTTASGYVIPFGKAGMPVPSMTFGSSVCR